MSEVTKLHFSLLGSPQINVNCRSLEVDRQKAIALLVYLAVNGERYQRQTLATLFWPEHDDKRAHANLRHVLWVLKKAIGPDWLEIDRSSVGLRYGFEADFLLFEEKLEIAQEKMNNGNNPSAQSEALTLFEEAADLHRDTFLAGFTLRDTPDFDAWQLFQAQHYRQKLESVVQILIDSYRHQGHWQTAIQHGQRWLALDPLHEHAHVQLMQLYMQAGEKSAAIRQYELCYRTLTEELDVHPTTETTELYKQIKHNQIIKGSNGDLTRQSHFPNLAVVHHLPEKQTSFVGRQLELTQLNHFLSDPECRLLSLVGPGGMGKTRLAIEAVRATQDIFSDGVHFISLAPINTFDNLISAIANTLQLSFYEGRNPYAQLIDYLKSKKMLLLLDNLEHLLPESHKASEMNGNENRSSSAISSFIVDLLKTAIDLKIVVTSRKYLPLQQGQVFHVSGLELSNKDAKVPMSAAVQLFRERAHQLQFEMNAGDELIALDICRLLKGNPLAIELAAALVSVLPLIDILVEVRENLDVLATTSQDIEPRHRSIRAVFDSSWQTLSASEQIIFAKLSLFRGGCTREAATEVAQATLFNLSGFVHKSLLQHRTNGRYEMHELMRHYAAQKLAGMPSQQMISQRQHSIYYGRFLNQQIQLWQTKNMLTAVNEVAREIENIQAGLATLFEQGHKQFEELIAYVNNLWHFYNAQSRLTEAIDMLNQAIALLEVENIENKSLKAKWQYLLSVAFWGLGQLNESYDHLQKAISQLDKPMPRKNVSLLFGIFGQLCRQFFTRIQFWHTLPQEVNQTAITAAQAYEQTASVAYLVNNMLLAIYSGIRGVNIAEQTKLSPVLATAYANMIIICGSFRLHRWAEKYVKLAQEASLQLNSLPIQSAVAIRHGIYRNGVGQWAQSKQELEKAIAISRRLEDWRIWGDGISNLAYISYFQGDFNGYRRHWNQLLTLTKTSHNAQHKAWAYTGQAQALVPQGNLDEAIALLEKAYPILESVTSARIGKIGYHSISALAHLHRKERLSAEISADKAVALVKQSSPVSYVAIYIYSELAEVYLTLLEHAVHDPTASEQIQSSLKKKAVHVCRLLNQFAWIHPVARPYSDLHRGQLAWLAGQKRRARRSWQKSITGSQTLGMAYIEAVAHYEIGRRASGAKKHTHLLQAREIFSRLKTTYYLGKTEEALR